jgi:hypothetical protein
MEPRMDSSKLLIVAYNLQANAHTEARVKQSEIATWIS